MSSPTCKFLNFRVIVFALLMALSWGLWRVSLPGTDSDLLGWLVFSSWALLLAWSFVLHRRERWLAWACWLSVLAMICFGIAFPWK